MRVCSKDDMPTLQTVNYAKIILFEEKKVIICEIIQKKGWCVFASLDNQQQLQIWVSKQLFLVENTFLELKAL